MAELNITKRDQDLEVQIKEDLAHRIKFHFPREEIGTEKIRFILRKTLVLYFGEDRANELITDFERDFQISLE